MPKRQEPALLRNEIFLSLQYIFDTTTIIGLAKYY